jgi:hypothetical protein
MSEQTYTTEQAQDMRGFKRVNGWGRVANPIKEARIASAAAFWADVLMSRIPSYYLREMIAPTNPQIGRVLDSNYPHLLHETMTSSDFPLLTGDVLDRMLLQRFRGTTPVWNRYIRQRTRPLRDFRTARGIQTDGGDGRWNAVPAGDEFEYTSMQEAGYTITPNKYAQGMKLDWEAIMNDDLDAFDQIPEILGLGGRRTIDYFATSLLFDSSGPHASYFTVGNGNVLSGNPALSVASLGTAIEQIAAFTDVTDNPISLMGLRLVYGPNLRVTAQNIANQMVVDVTEAGGTSAQTVRVNNWLAADIEFVEDPFVPVVATGNTGSWLLMLDPDNNRPAAEMAFLAGFNEPQLFQKLSNTIRVGGNIDQAMGDWRTMATEYKGVIAFGGSRTAIPTDGDPNTGVGSNGSGS